MSDVRKSVSLSIPGVGKVEINHLGYRFQHIPYEAKDLHDSLEKEMAVVNHNGKTCLICHPDNLIELCGAVMSDTFIDEYTQVFSRDRDFWTDRRNVYGGIYTVEDNECIEELFYEFLYADYIIKVTSDDLLEISKYNYVFVVPDYYRFRIEKKLDTYEKCVLIVKKYIEQLLEEEEEDSDDYCSMDSDLRVCCTDALEELDKRLRDIQVKKAEKAKNA